MRKWPLIKLIAIQDIKKLPSETQYVPNPPEITLLEELDNVGNTLGSEVIYQKVPLKRLLPTQRKFNYFFM